MNTMSNSWLYLITYHGTVGFININNAIVRVLRTVNIDNVVGDGVSEAHRCRRKGEDKDVSHTDYLGKYDLLEWFNLQLIPS